jgi:hypothetical protein
MDNLQNNLQNNYQNNLPPGFYSEWNLPPEEVTKLNEYSLASYDRMGLRLALYKEYIGDIVGMTSYEKKLLYKEKLFTCIWQNDSLDAFLELDKRANNYYFIVSIREYWEETGEATGEVKRVALIQFDRTKTRKSARL